MREEQTMVMDDYQNSNLRMAKELSNVILGDLEINQLPISQILMKAKRLARMLHDSDAQKWLDYEIMGYPVVFDPDELGTCKKYYMSDRPVIRDEKTRRPHSIGLPHLESYINSTKIDSVTKIGANESQKIQILNKHHELVNDFERLKTMVHNYITEVNISLSVGEFAEDIFEDTRLAADKFIRENCPRAGEQLLEINERMKYFDPDSYSQALAAVQKILTIVSGTLVPSGEKTYRDKKGHERSVEPDQYLNRIFSYIEQNSGNDPVITVVESEMAYIFAKAEHCHDKTKVLHERVSKEDVELAIIHMYLVIAEIAKIRKIETIYLKTPPSGTYDASPKLSPPGIE
jgi:hypothetical protein